MKFNELAKKRYSCKKYSDRKVGQAELDAILLAGKLAPTAKNLQEQRIYVVQSEEGLAKVDACTPCRYGASTVLIVAYDDREMFTMPGGKLTSGAEDAYIVATHLMLGAADVDVDSCWLNNFDPEKVESVFALPENEHVVMMLDLGYAAEGAGPLANHALRKDLSETVKYI